MNIYNLDCRDVMSMWLPENSVDSIVTDPPYGLGFMGKEWDHGVPGREFWERALHVLKPGGHLLAFGGSRTYHRLVCAVEDAGFEIRDQILWLYGSGFPKSHNGPWGGTALKPAHEPIVLARKPLIGTVAANVLAYGTGGLNVDGCRVGEAGGTAKGSFPKKSSVSAYGNGLNGACEIIALNAGRWPANLIHDGSDEVLAAFPDAQGQKGRACTDGEHRQGNNMFGALKHITNQPEPRGDSGSAARFFYCAKASKKDRDEGLDDAPDRVLAYSGGAAAAARGEQYDNGDSGMNSTKGRKNNHPTVKPTELMRYLCRLVTPPGGVVLDPFMGSGSTGKAARLEGFSFIGCEIDEAYFTIAQARIG